MMAFSVLRGTPKCLNPLSAACRWSIIVPLNGHGFNRVIGIACSRATVILTGSANRTIYNLCFPFHSRTRRCEGAIIIKDPLALDDKIYDLRRDKIKQIEALGQESYPRKYDLTHSIPQVLAEYSGKTAEELEQSRVKVRVAGRIMAIRLMGKAGFAHLQQAGQRLQIYLKKDAVGDQGFDLYKLLDLGDHIGAATR